MFHSIRYWRLLPDLLVTLGVVLCHWVAAWYWMRRVAPEWRRSIQGAAGVSSAFLTWGFLLSSARVAGLHPAGVASWGRAATLAWAGLSLLFIAGLLVAQTMRVRREHHPARRAFLRTAQAALFGAPVAALGYGVFVQRHDLRLREENIVIPGLPQELDGLSLVQLTDIHLGPFLDGRELERAVDMANETRAKIALVTGDLISSQGDPLDECIERLSRLRAEAGVFGCLGNHEIYAGAEAYTAQRAARCGMRFLRQQSATLQFGGAKLNLAGVDYQRFGRPYLVGAEKLRDPSAFNLLLSHNPDVFPVAAAKGFPLTLAGHTHGGQVRVEILHQDLNVARFFTPYVDGVYRQENSTIFVSRGIGTIGMPARLGAPPEVALIHLWRT